MRERFIEFFAQQGWPQWLIPSYWTLLTVAIIAGALLTLYLVRSRSDASLRLRAGVGQH